MNEFMHAIGLLAAAFCFGMVFAAGGYIGLIGASKFVGPFRIHKQTNTTVIHANQERAD